MEPNLMRPLTGSEVSEAFSNAHNEQDCTGMGVAVWGFAFDLYYDDVGVYHRIDDLPANVWEDGKLAWFVNGKPHRDFNRPAVIHADGKMEWWVNGTMTGDQDDPPPDAVFPGQQTKSASKK